MISKCLRNWTVSCKIPTYLGTRPQFEAEKEGLTTGARSNTAQSVSQSVSMSERTGKLGFLSYWVILGKEICFVVEAACAVRRKA